VLRNIYKYPIRAASNDRLKTTFKGKNAGSFAQRTHDPLVLCYASLDKTFIRKAASSILTNANCCYRLQKKLFHFHLNVSICPNSVVFQFPACFLITSYDNFMPYLFNNKSTQKSPWEPNSHTRLLKKLPAFCVMSHAHKSQPLVPILNQKNPAKTFRPYLFKNHINIILSSTPKCSDWFISLIFSHSIFHVFLFANVHCSQ
jgi:hypothetical protein